MHSFYFGVLYVLLNQHYTRLFFLKAVCKMKYRTIYQARVLEIPPCLYQAFIIC